MTETKLNGLTIHNIDSKETYDALVAAGLIGENDLALVKEDASAFNLGITGASVGDIIKVKQVDADGKPTAWEAAKSVVEIANGVDVSAVSSAVYTMDISGNAIKSNHLKLVLSAPNITDEQKWIHIKINDFQHAILCYFNKFWVCDIQILKNYICITFGKGDFSTSTSGNYAWNSTNKAEYTYVLETTKDYTNLNKSIACLLDYGSNNILWGESAKLWIWGE